MHRLKDYEGFYLPIKTQNLLYLHFPKEGRKKLSYHFFNLSEKLKGKFKLNVRSV